MADSIATLPKSEVVSRLQNARTRLSNMRQAYAERVETGARRVTVAVGVQAGAFGAGVVEETLPEVIDGVPTNLLAGGALIAAGVVGLGGDQSDAMVAVGSGVLAGASFEKGRDFGRSIAK